MKNKKLITATVSQTTADAPEYEQPMPNFTEFEKGLREESSKRQARFVAMGFDKSKRQFTKLTDEVAQSDHWMKNEPIPFGLDLFPPASSLWFMRYSDLFYPNARGGPLWIDTPGSSTEYNYCEQKLKAYQAKGVRYTYVKPNEDVTDVQMRLDPILIKGNQ